MSSTDAPLSSTVELALPSTSPTTSQDGYLHSTPTQTDQAGYFTPHGGRPLSVFDNARIDGRRPWASVDCGPGGLPQDESPHRGWALVRSGGSAGGVDAFYSPESDYTGQPMGGYAASPGVSSVLEQMSLGHHAHARSSPAHPQPSARVVFDNPSPFEHTLDGHGHNQNQQAYISPNQPFQPLPHGTPSRESYYPLHQDGRHLSTPVSYHLSNSSSMSSMSSSNDLSTPPNAPYQVLGPDGYIYASTPLRTQNASAQGQLQSPYYPQPLPASRSMMKRSRSSLSSSPHEYDEGLHRSDQSGSVCHNSWHDTHSGGRSVGCPPSTSDYHDGLQRQSPQEYTSDGRPEKKNKRTYEPALLWSADGSEVPDELRGWTPEMMQDEWKQLRGSEYRPSISAAKPFALTVAQEIAFLTACYYLPVLGRIRVLFFGRLCGRNEILSTFVNMVEGDPVFYRSKKRISSLFANLRKVTKRVPPCINALLERVTHPEMVSREQSGHFSTGVFHHVHPALYDVLGLPVGTDLSTAERPAWLEILDREVDEAERLSEEAKDHRRRTKGNLQMVRSPAEDDRDPDFAPSGRAKPSRPSPLRRQSCSATVASSPVSDVFGSPSTRPEMARRTTTSGAIQFTPKRTSYSPKFPSPLQMGDHAGGYRPDPPHVTVDSLLGGITPAGQSALGLVFPVVVPVECAFYATQPLEAINGRTLASVPSGWDASSIAADMIHFDDIHIVRDRYPNLRQLAARSNAPALHIQIALDLPSIEEVPSGASYLSARLDLSCAWGPDLELMSVVSSSVDDGPVMASASPIGQEPGASDCERTNRSIELPVGFISSLLEQTCGARSETVVVADISRSVAPLYLPSSAELREGLRADVLPALAVLQEIVSRSSAVDHLPVDEVCPGAISEGTKLGDAVHLVAVYSFSLAEPGEGGTRIQTISFERRSKSTSPADRLASDGRQLTPTTLVQPSLSFSPPSPRSAAKLAMPPPSTTGRKRAPSARNKANLSITLPPVRRLDVIPAGGGADGAAEGPMPYTPLDKINLHIPSAPPPINLNGLQPRRLFGSMASAGPYSGGGVEGSLQPASQQQQQQRLLAATNGACPLDGTPLPSPGIFAVGNQARQRMAGWTESQLSPHIGLGQEPSMDNLHAHADLLGDDFPEGHHMSIDDHHYTWDQPHLALADSVDLEGSFGPSLGGHAEGQLSGGAGLEGLAFDGADMFDFDSFGADGTAWMDPPFDPPAEAYGLVGVDGERMDECQLLF